ncbi:putative Major facilitator superfamily (MFS) profile domain-containing protein [Seiridium unicorne]|uniref:Major facilitator superfamily (MFS) profile domain-containing protein n=1 Tax=Seiridium unicorne TaxID=138068 RepID=A0ABR2UQX7_9PEZI
MADIAPPFPIDEKRTSAKGDSTHDGSHTTDVSGEVPAADPVLTKKVTRKIDIALLPLLGMMYLLAFLDRTNIATAKLNGFEADLGMPSNGYNTALWVFYLPFVLLEVPCNLVLGWNKVKPSYWLGGIIFILGVTSMCQGLTHSAGGLYACRALMGAVEAGVQPGAGLLMGQYYRRSEFAPRFSFFICCALLGNTFSAFLAYAISHMDGLHGLEGWRWIFILEGIVTGCFGFVLAIFTPDWPEKARFLKDHERDNLLARLEAERGQEKMDMQNVDWVKCVLNWKTWAVTLVFFCCDMSAASTVSFSPTILSQLGYSGNRANVMLIPIYLVGAFLMVSSGWIAGRLNNRSGVIVLGAAMSIVGWAIQRAQVQPAGVRYFGLYMIYWGANIQMPNCVAWFHSNVVGRPEKAVGMAIIAGFGNACNFVASNVFIASEAPRYPTAFSAGLSIQSVGFVSCIALAAFFYALNKKAGTKKYHL